MTKVLFRKVKYGYFKGDIDAVFPELPGTNDPSTCVCYSHIGQHSSCMADYYIYETVPATPDEYKSLWDELVSIGYDDLRVVKRMTHGNYETRQRAVKQ